MSHWQTHLNPTPHGPNLQTLGGVRLGPTRGINLCFLYEDQDSTKYVKFG